MTYVKTTWVDNTTSIDATKLNNIEAGIEALDTCAGAAISFPARALDTVYQNTSGVTIIVVVCCSFPAGTSISAYVGATSSPATLVATQANGSSYGSSSLSVTFAVAPSYYYKVAKSGSVTISGGCFSETKVH